MEDTQVTNVQVVQAALSGDPVSTERLFTSRLNSVLADKIDNMRADIASTILTAEPATNDGNNQ